MGDTDNNKDGGMMMSATHRFTQSLAGGMEDALCIQDYVDDYLEASYTYGETVALCSILSILWSAPVLMEMHGIA